MAPAGERARTLKRDSAQATADHGAQAGPPLRSEAHALQLALMAALPLRFFGARPCFHGDARLLDGGELHCLEARLFLALAKSCAVAFFGGGVLACRDLCAFAQIGSLARILRGALDRFARQLLPVDAFVLELHQLFEGEVHALITSGTQCLGDWRVGRKQRDELARFH